MTRPQVRMNKNTEKANESEADLAHSFSWQNGRAHTFVHDSTKRKRKIIPKRDIVLTQTLHTEYIHQNVAEAQ